MIFYIENPKDPMKKMIELIHKFSKAAGYGINIQKSVAFLHTSNEAADREIKGSVPFTITLKSIRYLV